MNATAVCVTFYQVLDNPQKVALICQTSESLFRQKKKLLILTPNFPATQYIEELLWRLPPEGFLPHVVADTATAEWIAISLQQEVNVNKAPYLFNLRQEAVEQQLASQGIQEIYEFWDETDPQKKANASKKWSDYESRGFLVTLSSCSP